MHIFFVEYLKICDDEENTTLMCQNIYNSLQEKKRVIPTLELCYFRF